MQQSKSLTHLNLKLFSLKLVSLNIFDTLGDFFGLVGDAALGYTSNVSVPFYHDDSSNLFIGYDVRSDFQTQVNVKKTNFLHVEQLKSFI